MECKFYTGSVPYDELSSKLEAAHAHRKHCLLVITNSFLMNTCLDKIEEWRRRHGNPFRFAYWNGYDLARRIAQAPSVLVKHFSTSSAEIEDNLRYQAQRREAILAGIAARVQRAIVPMAQSIESSLSAHELTPPWLRALLPQCRSLVGQLHALKFLALQRADRPSTRVFDIATLVSEVLEFYRPRTGARISITLEQSQPTFTLASPPLLSAAISELIDNAARYAATSVVVRLLNNSPLWTLEVQNNCSHQGALADIVDWPQLGIRSESARHGHPSGLGYGCWIAGEICKSMSIAITWRRGRDSWAVTLQGTVVPKPDEGEEEKEEEADNDE